MESLESRVTVYFDHDQPRVRGVLRPEGSVTQFVRIGMRTRVGYTLRGSPPLQKLLVVIGRRLLELHNFGPSLC